MGSMKREPVAALIMHTIQRMKVSGPSMLKMAKASPKLPRLS